MNIFKNFKSAAISSTTVVMLATSNVSLAETVQNNVAVGSGGHSVIQRVSHSLAESTSYTRSGTSGYKWGKQAESTSPSFKWGSTEQARGGNKWASERTQNLSSEQALVESAGYQWGSMNFSDQSAFKWGLKSFGEQAAFKWGLKSFGEQR